jgi:hypothetical protein
MLTALITGVYAIFLSQHYIGDGVRWLSVITQSVNPPVDWVRHALFPTLGWAWYHLWRILGYDGNPIPLLQMMNALAGGIGAALFYLFLKHLTHDRVASIIGCVLLSLSTAYNAHATDMTEVMPSFAVTMGALMFALQSARRESLLLAMLSALLVSLATGLFISSILCVPAVAFLMLVVSQQTRSQKHIKTPLAFVTATSVLTPLVFILTFSLAYSSSILETVRFVIEEQQRVADMVLDAGFALNRFGGVLFGWADAVLGLQKFSGIRVLFSSLNTWEAWWNLGILSLLIMMIGMLAGSLCLRLRGRDMPWWPWLFGLLWFIPGVMLAWYTEPTHSKLWVHPLVGFIFLITWSLGLLRLRSRLGWALRIWMASFLILVAGVNIFANMIPRAFTPSPWMNDAHRLAEMIRDQDLLISESFNPVSVYFSSVFNRSNNFYSFFVTGHELKFNNNALRVHLHRTIDNRIQQGGHIYFLGVFDETWGHTLREKISEKKGLDYTMLESYRRDAFPIFRVPSLEGPSQSVWLYEYRISDKN